MRNKSILEKPVGGTSADIADAIAKKHTQGTDTTLGTVGTKNPPIDADKVIYRDSTASDALVTSTWAQIKTFFGLVLTQTANAIGFSLAGGTTSKTLTVEDTSLINQDLTSDAGPTFDHIHIAGGIFMVNGNFQMGGSVDSWFNASAIVNGSDGMGFRFTGGDWYLRNHVTASTDRIYWQAGQGGSESGATRTYMTINPADASITFAGVVTAPTIAGLSVPDANGEAIRATAKITEALLESATDRIAELTTASSPAFVTVKCSGLTDGYIPYHVSDATGLANSPLYAYSNKLAMPVTVADESLTMLDMQLYSSVSSSATKHNYGLDVTASKKVPVGVTDSGSLRGMRSTAMRNHLAIPAIDDSGTLTTLWGMQSQYGNFNTDAVATPTTTSAIGLYLTGYASTGVVTTMTGISINQSGALVSTNYGLKVGNLTGTVACYAIYTGTGLVQFGDEVLIATGGLHVGGTSLAGDNNLLVDGTGTITGAFGCNGVAAGTKSAHIADATGAADVITRANAILVVLEKFGFVATS